VGTRRHDIDTAVFGVTAFALAFLLVLLVFFFVWFVHEVVQL
jgi:hypothetical protein